eukprot:1524812-Rhodomonas_salina.2
MHEAWCEYFVCMPLCLDMCVCNGAVCLCLSRGRCCVAGGSLQCPAGKYAILEAAFNETLWTARAESMLELCHECDADANCTGGASVVPKAGFWELPRAEAHEEGSSLDASKVYIYECAAGGCVEGGGCAATREGPVCALCVPGFAMSGGACTRCGELGKGWARWMLLALLLAVVLVLWWYVALANLFKFREGRGERPVAATLLGSRKMREALKMVVRVAQVRAPRSRNLNAKPETLASNSTPETRNPKP